MLGHHVYEAVINWCGHGNEFILVPEPDGPVRPRAGAGEAR